MSGYWIKERDNNNILTITLLSRQNLLGVLSRVFKKPGKEIYLKKSIYYIYILIIWLINIYYMECNRRFPVILFIT